MAVPENPNVHTVKRFLQLLEVGDIDAWIELWADDGLQLMPYASGLFPGEIRGRAALDAHWRALPPQYDYMRFPIERIFEMKDSAIVGVSFKGEIKLAGVDDYYNNDYFCIFEFDATGRISRYTEYFNPLVIVRSFQTEDRIQSTFDTPKTSET